MVGDFERETEPERSRGADEPEAPDEYRGGREGEGHGQKLRQAPSLGYGDHVHEGREDEGNEQHRQHEDGSADRERGPPAPDGERHQRKDDQRCQQDGTASGDCVRCGTKAVADPLELRTVVGERAGALLLSRPV